MRNFALLLVLLLLSCQSSKQIFDKNKSFTKINVEFKSSQNKINLNGFSYFHPDSNILNMYGPLGINVAKVVTKYDSIKIVDIQNKKIYAFKYFDGSRSIYNFFNGQFSANEQHLVCSICSLFLTGLNCIKTYDENSLFGFKTFRSGNSRYIKGSLSSSEGLFTIKIKMSDNNNSNSLSTSLSKYVNFENIYLNLK